MAGKKLTLRGDKVIWMTVLLMAMISIVAVYSSSYALAYRAGLSTFHFLFSQMQSVGISLLVLFACYRAPLKIYRIAAVPFLGVTLLMLLGVIVQYYVLHTTRDLGAARWLDLGIATVQPSEFAKIGVVLYLAKILEAKKFNKFTDFLLWIVVPVGGLCTLTLIGSFSVTLIVLVVTFIILVCSNIPKKFILWSAGGAVVLLSAAFLLNVAFGTFSRLDTVRNRIERHFSDTTLMSEEELADYEAKKYQSRQAEEAIQLGGLTGIGPGNSIKRTTLPNPYDDYIYAIIVEEWGFIGGAAVLMLYIWFLFRCVIITSSCKKTFSAVAVLGLSSLISIQAMIHIAVNIGLFPETGQTLPMISHGGTAYLLMSSAFGIILCINRTIEISAEKEKIALLWNKEEQKSS